MKQVFMRLYYHTEELVKRARPMVVALGMFDGVHVGHKSVIREAVKQAHDMEGDAGVVTFHPHPAKLLRPEKAPLMLTTEEQDLELFGGLDVDFCLILDFNEELSSRRAEDFLNHLGESIPHLRGFVVGPAWHFGHQREGNFALLKKWADEHHVFATEMPPAKVDGAMVSSTSIRELIAEGQIVSANARLGRPYQLVGVVRHGEGLGHRLGFPTANLEIENELIPKRGVYAARVLVEGVVFAAAVNIGCRPTVSEAGVTTVEAHLLFFDGDLYGHHLRLDFLGRIRDEQRFESVEDLKQRMITDIQLVTTMILR